MRPWRTLALCLTIAACGAEPDAIMAPDGPAAATMPEGMAPDGVDADIPLAAIAAIAALPGPAPLVGSPDQSAAQRQVGMATPDDTPDAPPDIDTVPAAAVEPAEPPSRAALACAARGGVFSSPPDGGLRACVRRMGDGGKTCQQGGDCQGQCLARSRSCAPIDPLLGCNEILQDDGVRVTLCVD